MKTAKNTKTTNNRAAQIFGHSVTAVCKTLGAKNWDTDAAVAAVSKSVGRKFKISRSTIATAMSDGKNVKYRKGAAKLSKEELTQLRKLAAANN